MVIASVVCFALAALGGVLLASLHLREKTPPLALALVHGLFAASGLGLLVVSVVGGVGALGQSATVSLVAMLVAALGGFYLFSRRFAGGKARPGVIVVHALVAVLGFALLLVGVFA